MEAFPGPSKNSKSRRTQVPEIDSTKPSSNLTMPRKRKHSNSHFKERAEDTNEEKEIIHKEGDVVTKKNTENEATKEIMGLSIQDFSPDDPEPSLKQLRKLKDFLESDCIASFVYPDQSDSKTNEKFHKATIKLP